MNEDRTESNVPDLTKGIAASELADGGMLLGRVGEEHVLLARRGAQVFAVGAHCSHYHGPLIDGLVVGHTIRCPWHHACFDLRTGEALHAPAFGPIAAWSVDQEEGKIFVRRRLEAQITPRAKGASAEPKKIVVVGGGAAGFSAAEMLRRQKYQGEIVMLSSDESAPVDRPNLSKDYLAGSAPEEWVPLQPDSFYADNHIDLRLKTPVVRIDVRSRQATLGDGKTIAYDRLLIATGAEPVRLPIPGANQPQVFVLRSLADCRAIIERAKSARRAVVLGASFIGLEVAAALRARNIEVHVVAPEKRPMEPILGPQFGDFVRGLHEERGVIFHLQDTPAAIEGAKVRLNSGGALEADLVVMGVGVRPRVALAEAAGLAVDRGLVVNAHLETNANGIFAAGDVARWPDAHSGRAIRVEHWVVAERQGQVAALNMLGAGERFAAVPFFWSQHYETPINYVGHAEKWDKLEIEGDVAAKDCLARYKVQGRTLAIASIYRDLASLQAEASMEQSL
jgi:NADPH-dependent 2,4-dienoyl-CoA reductase/sulfur reductase-like enzyme/nitrite reductase/ring-hydroxylating ferredoxin subunit